MKPSPVGLADRSPNDPARVVAKHERQEFRLPDEALSTTEGVERGNDCLPLRCGRFRKSIDLWHCKSPVSLEEHPVRVVTKEPPKVTPCVEPMV